MNSWILVTRMHFNFNSNFIMSNYLKQYSVWLWGYSGSECGQSTEIKLGRRKEMNLELHWAQIRVCQGSQGVNQGQKCSWVRCICFLGVKSRSLLPENMSLWGIGVKYITFWIIVVPGVVKYLWRHLAFFQASRLWSSRGPLSWTWNWNRVLPALNSSKVAPFSITSLEFPWYRFLSLN